MIGLLALLVILTGAAAVRETAEPAMPALSSESTAPNGGRALWLWLDDAGYRVRNEVASQFEIPEGTSLMMLLDPNAFPSITEDEWNAIDAWVTGGGLLILAGDGLGTSFAAEHFGVEFRFLSDPADRIFAANPLMANPPLSAPIEARVFRYLDSDREDFLPILTAGNQPVAALLREGNGHVFINASGVPFSNTGLGTSGNAEIVLNQIGGVNEGELIWFDEWHHGKRLNENQEILGPGNWLRFTAPGHAMIFIASVIFIGIVLSGKSFGRTVPVKKTTLRRAPLEYVSAIANLSRRAGHKRAALAHYHSQIKRHFGRRYRLDPGLRDREFLETLEIYAPHLDIDSIRSLLRRIRNTKMSENEMVQLVREAAALIDES